MNQEKLENAKKLLFLALGIDIAVTALGAMTDVWIVFIFNEVSSAAGLPAIIGTLEFGDVISTVMILTLIGVGLALLRWLGSCYAYAKESLSVTGFAQEGWKTWGWIVPFMNLFKPYQVLSEIYKVGAADYVGGDEWKKASGSRLLLVWWSFWVIAHMITWGIGKQVLMSSFRDDLPLDQALNQIIAVYYMSITICVISLVVSGLWFVVAGNLTKRLLNRPVPAMVLEAPMDSSPSDINVAPGEAKPSVEPPRIDEMTFAERIRPKRSLPIAALVGTIYFLFLFANGYPNAKRLVAENSLENQLEKQVVDWYQLQIEPNHERYPTRKELDAIIPGNPQSIVKAVELAKVREERAKVCEERVKQVLDADENTGRGKFVFGISPEALHQLLAEKACDFHEPKIAPKIADYLHLGEYTATALAASALAYVLCSLAFWVLTYSHLGWRRIAVIFGPLCGVGLVALLLENYEKYPSETFIITLAAAIASSVAIVIAREGFLWVWRGFGENRHERKGSSVFCNQCGTAAVADAKFCASCGGALNQGG